jgi:glycosyltransferase involved in cell wall biosynthesis
MADARERLVYFPPSLGQNPYLSLLYGHLAVWGLDVAAGERFTLAWIWGARRDVSFLHFHWRPDKYYSWARPPDGNVGAVTVRLQGVRSWGRFLLFAARLGVARTLGYRIAWTIHELYPPETRTRPPGSVSRRLDRIASSVLARTSHILFAHDAGVASAARAEFGAPADRIEVIPHGSYLDDYPPGRPREAIRDDLEIAQHAFAFLCFGKLRPDKQIEFLLSAFRSIDDPDLALVVAGLVEDERSAALVRQAAAADPRIKALLEFVPSDRVAELYGACDAAVLARGESWTSASLILSLSLGVPVVAARLPSHEALLADGRAGWLFEAGDVEALRAALLAAAANPASTREKRRHAVEQARSLPDWAEIAARTAAALNGSVKRNGRGGSLPREDVVGTLPGRRG